ncbi:hypothetical protein ACFYM2_24850 [Streptomyces sp. NPDC006711]|uniref:hypothetical protein n=1 Tax=Streptomyces sp. NPDC006711 TaxID=3364762 RepID=UPI003693B977
MFAAMCVLLAALGHIMMSGCTVPWWALLAGFAATGGVSWTLAGRERGLTLIVTLVVGAQTVLHWGFALAQAETVPDSPGKAMRAMPMGAMDMSGLHGHSMTTRTHVGMGNPVHTSAGEGGLGHWLMSGMPSWGMSMAHLVVAVLCGLWLGYGERVAYRLLRAVGGWLAAPLRLVITLPALPRRPRRLVRRSRSRWVPCRLHLVHAITTRGPPMRTAVV